MIPGTNNFFIRENFKKRIWTTRRRFVPNATFDEAPMIDQCFIICQ